MPFLKHRLMKTLAAAWSAVISRPFGSAWLLSTPSPVTTGSHRFGGSSYAAIFNAIRRTWDIPVTTWPTWAPHRSKAARRSVPHNVCEFSMPKPVLMRSSSAGSRSSCNDRRPSAPLLWEKPENDEVLERKKRGGPVLDFRACEPGRALQPRPVLQSLGCEAERPRRTSFMPACLNLSASSCGSIPSASITALTMESDKISVSVGSR
jgi:hypothetical protein